MSQKNKSSNKTNSEKCKNIKEKSDLSVSESLSAYQNSKNNVNELNKILQNLKNKKSEDNKLETTFNALKEEEENLLQLYLDEDNVKNEIQVKDNFLNFNDEIFEKRTVKILADVYDLKEYVLYPYFTVEYSPKKKSNVFKIYYYRFNIEYGEINQSENSENAPQNDKKKKNNNNKIGVFNFLDDRKTYMLSFQKIPMIFQKDNQGFISVTVIPNDFESSSEFTFQKNGKFYETSFNCADICKEVSEIRGIMTKTQNQRDSTNEKPVVEVLNKELNSINKMYDFLKEKYSKKNLTNELNKKKKELEYFEERLEYEKKKKLRIKEIVQMKSQSTLKDTKKKKILLKKKFKNTKCY